MTAEIRTLPGLAEQVYQAVLDEICDGALPAGTPLVQEQLAERFGVSRQPIQQAIARLKADGLLEDAGRRGVRVTALDLATMRHHYAIRAALDGLAARLAAERAARDTAVAEDARRRGGAILALGTQAVASGDVRAQIRHDEAFHRLLYELSGNLLLASTAEPHWRFLRRVMGDVLRHAEPAPAIWRQHAGILDAVVAGDPARAERDATDHINVAAGELTLAASRDSTAGAAPARRGHPS